MRAIPLAKLNFRRFDDDAEARDIQFRASLSFQLHRIAVMLNFPGLVAGVIEIVWLIPLGRSGRTLRVGGFRHPPPPHPCHTHCMWMTPCFAAAAAV